LTAVQTVRVSVPGTESWIRALFRAWFSHFRHKARAFRAPFRGG
jgi:hypothetical protein